MPCLITSLAIIGATVAYYVIGAVWFSVFSKPYLKDLGKTPKQMKQGPSILQASLLQIPCAIITAFILHWFITVMHAWGVFGGMQVAAAAWLGFVACIMGPTYAYQAFSLRFFLINAGYQLIGLLAMGAILGLVG
jgi:hypothetical protein